jgi:hypothetical protein
MTIQMVKNKCPDFILLRYVEKKFVLIDKTIKCFGTRFDLLLATPLFINLLLEIFELLQCMNIYAD